MGCDIDSSDHKVSILGLSYTAFHELKEKLLDLVCLRVGEIIDPGTWQDTEFKAFKVFYEHDDTDGVMSPEECRNLADLLAHLVPLLSSTDTGSSRVGIWRTCGERLLDGMRYCADAKVDAVFH